MSNYERENVRHPITGVVSSATMLDNYFGHHRYGVKFPGDDQVYDMSNEMFHHSEKTDTSLMWMVEVPLDQLKIFMDLSEEGSVLFKQLDAVISLAELAIKEEIEGQ